MNWYFSLNPKCSIFELYRILRHIFVPKTIICINKYLNNKNDNINKSQAQENRGSGQANIEKYRVAANITE